MIDLKKVIEDYPECIENSEKLKSYLANLYPSEKVKINIIVAILNCGIANEINQLSFVDEMNIEKFCNNLENEYGYSQRFSEECLNIWAIAYGKIGYQNNSDSITAKKPVEIVKKTVINYNPFDFEIENGVLKKYRGNSEEVYIPNSVTSIGYGAFENCQNLIDVTIPDSVTEIGADAFYGCTYLTNITIPDSVTSIGYSAFHNCAYLTTITIPDNVTIIDGYAFCGCTSLTSITIPNSVTSIGERAFKDCSSLANIKVPDSVTKIGREAFYNTAYYNNTYLENGVLYIGNHLIFASKSLSGLYTIKLGTKTIAGGAFENCRFINTVAIPKSVISIGFGAFENCKGLKKIIIPCSVTSIEAFAFRNCNNLIDITVPDSVTEIGADAFYNTEYYNDWYRYRQ